MSEEITISQPQAVKGTDSQRKGRPFPMKKLARRAVPVLVALAVLIPTGVSVGLGAALTQTRAELSQVRQSGGVPAADGGSWYRPGLEGGAPQGDAAPAPADSQERGETGPEVPAYQELYPELYAQPHDWNTVNKAKVCYLTFDDGPSARTQEVLEILDRYGVKATFFVVGKDTEQSRQWMKQIVDGGHAIGVHSYTHAYRKIYASVEAYLDDFAQEYHLILEATGVAPQIFRFPGGSVNAYNGATYREIISEMVRRGFVYYDWNRQTGDAVKKTPSSAVLVKNALTRLEGTERIILLAHDSKRYTNMVRALPDIIEGYQAAGFSLKALTPEVRPIIFDYPR